MNNKYLKFATDLISMAKKDQKMRKKWADSGFNPSKYDSTIDKANEKNIEKIVSEIGWPSINKVGKKASADAWLLVQHVGENLIFQKKMLAKMKQLPQKEVDQKQIAKLEDRIL